MQWKTQHKSESTMSSEQSGRVENDANVAGVLGRRWFVSVAVFLVSLGLLTTGWLIKGDVSSAVRPDSDDFVLAGETIIQWLAGNVDIEAARNHAVFPYYFIPSVVLAGIHLYLDDPVVKAVALNCVLFSLLVVLIYSFWISVHGPWRSWMGRRGFFLGVVGGLYIIFGIPDPFLFSYTVLSDIMFLFWVTLFVVSVCRGILDGSRLSWIVALVLAVFAPFVRPTGVLLPILLLFGVGVRWLIHREVSLTTAVVVCLGIPMIVTFAAVPLLISAKLSGQVWVDSVIPDHFNRYFKIATHYFASGIIVSDRPWTDVESPSTYSDVLGMILKRLGYFWVPLRFGEKPFSMTHNMMNLVYLAFVWPLAIIGIRKLVAAGRRYQMVMLFTVVVALAFACLHSVMLLSFGWRYQLPAMVPLWMLAGVGLFGVLGYGFRTLTESRVNAESS